MLANSHLGIKRASTLTLPDGVMVRKITLSCAPVFLPGTCLTLELVSPGKLRSCPVTFNSPTPGDFARGPVVAHLVAQTSHVGFPDSDDTVVVRGHL